MNLSPLPIQKFFGNDGRPLVGGKLFTYLSGTSTKVATYTDAGGLTQNTNPIVLDYRGECRLWIDPQQSYTFVLAPSTDTDPPTAPIWTVNAITAAPSQQDNAATDTGSVNAIALSIPQISSPVAFTRIVFKVANTNTGPTTITINGGTAKNLRYQNTAAFSGGEILANGIYEAVFDGTQWQLQGPSLAIWQTAAEVTNSVTPTNYYYQPGDSRRYGATDTADGVMGWFDYGLAATRLSTSSFSVPGDQTANYFAQRRCKMIGGSTTYGRILTATFGAGITTVTLAMDGSSVVPNPMTLAPVQIMPNSVLPSSTIVDRNDEVYCYLFGNRNNGTSAVGKVIFGGGNSAGAFTGAVAIAAVPSTHGEYLVGSGISGTQAVIHTGAPTPILIGTADILRMYFPADGSEMKITSDLLLDKLSTTNSRGKIRINGTTDSMLELDSAGTQTAYFFTTNALTTLGSVTNIPFRIITNNTERLRIPAAGLGNYADDAAAAAGGVAVGEMYRNGSVLMIRVA